MAIMNAAGEWVPVICYPDLPKAPRPAAALAGWLRERGVDYWPVIADDDIRVDLCRVRRADGTAGCDVRIMVRAGVLWHLGLHPRQAASQTSSRPYGPCTEPG
jgi:hypothetical protein